MGETSSKPAERIRNFPPISHVLAMKGCPEVIDNLNNCLKYKGGHYLSSLRCHCIGSRSNLVSNQKSRRNLICHRCEKQIKFINELCYCPKDSGEKCHHGTSCCDNRKIKAWTSGH
uniref:Uncharacterized protein n=1 Tax=Globodera rostochiensis TaxID=31243 RepID=A0A914HRS2_GLORO